MTLAHDVVGAPGATTSTVNLGAAPEAEPGPVPGGVVPSRSPTVVFLHGILGSRNNWKSFAQKLVAACPQWRAVLCDLRNHGDSHGAQLAAPHTIDACADDVAATVQGPIDVVVGHSFGGKVALALARKGYAQETWVLDCPPGPRAFASAIEGGEIARVLEAIGSVSLPIASRAALVQTLRARGLSEALAKWMTTNLRSEGDGFVWKLSLDAIPEMLASFGAMDAWDLIDSGAHGRIVMVRAGRSDRWTADDVARLTRAAARGTVVEHVMPNAGHWLHTDDPATLLAWLTAALEARA